MKIKFSSLIKIHCRMKSTNEKKHRKAQFISIIPLIKKEYKFNSKSYE